MSDHLCGNSPQAHFKTWAGHHVLENTPPDRPVTEEGRLPSLDEKSYMGVRGAAPLRSRAVGKPMHLISQGAPVPAGTSQHGWGGRQRYPPWPGFSVFSWNPHDHSLGNARMGVQGVVHEESLAKGFW